jgi:UDP-glucose 4-epimerase
MSDGALLVTGGLGYIGGRVIRSLRRADPGREIRILTRRPAAARPAWASGLAVFQDDLLAPAALSAALRGVETVLHLAALNEVESQADPVRAVDVTIGGTVRLIRAARETGVRRMLYLSTIHVYGRLGAAPITEHTLPAPTHPYAITHLAAEHFVLAETRRGTMGGLVFRLSNGYGCPADPLVDRWTLVFLDLCRQAARSGVLALASSGRPQRDFISLEDVARAMEMALAWPEARWRGEVFNLGGGCSLPVREVADRIAAVYRRVHGGPGEVRLGPTGSADDGAPVDFRIDRLRAEGFVPHHDWDAEIAATLALCRASIAQ